MLTTVVDIFRAVQRAGGSLSIARQLCTMGNVTLNGDRVDFITAELDIKEGDVFELKGLVNQRWRFEGGDWQKVVI